MDVLSDPAYNTRAGLLQTPPLEKPARLLIRERPSRIIAIATDQHALILQHTPAVKRGGLIQSQNHFTNSGNGYNTPPARARPRPSGVQDTSSHKCMVEFAPVSEQTLAGFRPLISRPIHGTLGLLSSGDDVFLCVITHAKRVATLRPGETVERIVSVQFFCLNSAAYDEAVPADATDSYPNQGDLSPVYSPYLARREPPADHPLQDIQKLLSNGTFYYSTDFDATSHLQQRPINASTFDIDNFDERFLWNSYMIRPFVEFRSRLQQQEREALDESRILTSAICGFCETKPLSQAAAPLRSTESDLPSYVSVVSRLSCRRAGTRFMTRGIDDDGNVANFVETETIYWSPSGVLFSYVQVRGSVPVFWEQEATFMPGQQKITITRSSDGAQPAFNKHFSELEQDYGAVHIVNLLSAQKPGEADLTALYRQCVRSCPLSSLDDDKMSRNRVLLRNLEYDFHAETRTEGYEAARGIMPYLESSAEGFAYYLAEDAVDLIDQSNSPSRKLGRYVVLLQQEGVFRTNCLDCLDRTNLIQTIISQMAVEAFLAHKSEFANAQFWANHATLWADNGDALSKIYAGTGALKSSFTRSGKMSIGGALADFRKSTHRLIVNNIQDPGRQNTIDTLLGRRLGQVPVQVYDPISDFVNHELRVRSANFTSNQVINIWAGTFNLNGRTSGLNEDLSPWLCPPELGSTQPEIYAVGFQEIVELSPQQIMSSNPMIKKQWEKAIQRTLDARVRRCGLDDNYILFRSGQLVGAALCIFVKASAQRHVKNVEGSVKKTGMSGMAGNKGAVAVRLEYANTHLCFVTAHLAAGYANFEERNRDYATIHEGLRFQRNRSIDNHDTVIWLGDFNYRISLSNERTRELVRRGDLSALFVSDQLNAQMVNGWAFPYYSEAQITFIPTYKFDIGRDQYDTSERARIPAWTDRILRKGKNVRQLCYNSAPLRFSDHRPVYATFECTVTMVDEAMRARIAREVYTRRKAEVGDVNAPMALGTRSEEDLVAFDGGEPRHGLASLDRQKWWLQNGQMPRSRVSASREGPATSSLERSSEACNIPRSEARAIPRSESRQSSLSSMSSSPFEYITHSMALSHLSSSSPSLPRKYPVYHDSSTLPAKVGRMPVKAEAGLATTTRLGRDEMPTPPPPPPTNTGPAAAYGQVLAASAMTASEVREAPSQPTAGKTKKPPPIARKPAHLTTSKRPSLNTTGEEPIDAWHTVSSRESKAHTDEFPASPANQGLGKVSSAPPSTAGSALRQQQQAPPRVMNLMDEEEAVDANQWEVLRPTKAGE